MLQFLELLWSGGSKLNAGQHVVADRRLWISIGCNGQLLPAFQIEQVAYDRGRADIKGQPGGSTFGVYAFDIEELSIADGRCNLEVVGAKRLAEER